MSIRTILIGLFALVFALTAAGGAFLLSRSKTETVEMVTVVVAIADISRGQSVTAELLAERRWPKEGLPEGAITELQAAVDRAVLIPIVKGELMLNVKLASKGAGRGMAAIVPAGMRAVTIQTPNISTGVAGFILPGNKVDVLLTVSNPGANDPAGGATTFTLLQNVEILAVDQLIDAPQENKMDPKDLRSVTLMVTPVDAARLDLGQNQGTLHLSLRNPADIATLFVEPATLNGLNGVTSVPVETPPVVSEIVIPKPAPPEVIRRVRTLRGLQSGRIDFQPEKTSDNLPVSLDPLSP